MQMSRDHGREMSFSHLILILNVLPNVSIVTRKQGKKKGRMSNMKDY